MVVADMEAGLEHLSWAGGTLRHVDLLLVVVEPTAKSLMTGERTSVLAADLGIADVSIVANRTHDGDRESMEAFARGLGRALMAEIPDDDAVRRADRRGECVLDAGASSPSVRAIAGLADVIERRARDRGGAAGS